jgi:hypothetical protein
MSDPGEPGSLLRQGKAGVAWAGVRALFCLGRGNRGEWALIRNSSVNALSLLTADGVAVIGGGVGAEGGRRGSWDGLESTWASSASRHP